MSYPATSPYRDDLAFIHDAGFGHVAQNAATELLKLLSKNRKAGAASRRVVALGCGSGILAQAVSAAGYNVLGFDLSDSMLALAAKRARGPSSAGNPSSPPTFPRAWRSQPSAKCSITSSTAATGVSGFRPSSAACMKRCVRADCFCSTSQNRAAFAARDRSGAIRRDPGGPASIPPRKIAGEKRSRGQSQRSAEWAKTTAATARCTD